MPHPGGARPPARTRQWEGGPAVADADTPSPFADEPPFAAEDVWPGAPPPGQPRQPPRPGRLRWLLIALAALAVIGGVLWSVLAPGGTPVDPIPSPAPSPSPSPTPTPSTPSGQPPALNELASVIETIEQTRGVSLGVAIAPIAEPGDSAVPRWQGGTLVTGESWSTGSVPVALAVIRGIRQPEDLDYLLSRAISGSSGAGEDALFTFLGTFEQAAAATDEVFEDAGDATTRVPRALTRNDVSATAQMMWTASDQAAFAGQLYCMADSWQILTKMDEQEPAEKWGLGTLARTQFKSGSGTQANQTVLVRQMGIVTLADGSRVGVSLLAVAIDGSFQTSRDALTELAPQLVTLTHGFEQYSC